MNRILIALVFVFCCAFVSHGQKPTAKKIQEIKDEGTALYVLELANTTSLDVFYDNEYEKKGIVGSFSYKDKDSIRTVFYALIDTTNPKFRQQPDSIRKLYKTKLDITVISKTFSYGSSINKKNVKISEESRKPNDYEKKLFDARYQVEKEFDSDTSKYHRYEGTSMSMLFIDYKKFIKIYMITLSNQPDIMVFGNDYYFEYDVKTSALTKKQRIHQKYYNVYAKYSGKKNDPVKKTFHKHKDGDDLFITPTDICLLMLYKGGVKWEQHWVYSSKWVSVYTLYNGNLTITDLKTFEQQTKPKEVDPYANPQDQQDGN